MAWSWVRDVAYVSTDHMVEAMGLEPTTSCLQSRCSSQLSYAPEFGNLHGSLTMPIRST